MENIFIYEGLRFVPAGQVNVKDNNEFFARIFTDTRMLLKLNLIKWDFAKFTRLTANKHSDVFYCLDTKTLYLPAKNELFGWRDTVLEAEMNNKYNAFLLEENETKNIVRNMLGKQYVIVAPDGSKVDFDEVFNKSTWTGRIDESSDSYKNVRLFEDNVSTVRKMRDFIFMISSSGALESPIRVRLNEQIYLLRTGFVVEDNVVYIGTDNEISNSCSLQEIFNFFRAEEATDSWYTPCLVGDDRNRFDKCKVIIRLNGNHYKITKALWANVCNNECIYFEVKKL